MWWGGARASAIPQPRWGKVEAGAGHREWGTGICLSCTDKHDWKHHLLSYYVPKKHFLKSSFRECSPVWSLRLATKYPKQPILSLCLHESQDKNLLHINVGLLAVEVSKKANRIMAQTKTFPSFHVVFNVFVCVCSSGFFRLISSALNQVYCIIFISPYDDFTGEDILWILINTRHHGLTPLTSFHGTYKKFYFWVDCCHTLCLLTRINMEGHHIIYLTSPDWIYAKMFLLSTFSSMHVNTSYFCNLHMWINTIFSHADIAASFRVSLVVRVHSIWGHGGEESSLVLLW